MSKFKTKYKEFFGLSEQEEKKPYVPTDDDINQIKKFADVSKEAGLIDEAELINKMRNYRGGVEYVLYDPATADMVLNDIKTWAEKKGFTIIKMEKSPSGKIGYFYFRLGQEPFKEAKKIQGYISQLEQVKHFRFNVRQKKQKINKPLK